MATATITAPKDPLASGQAGSSTSAITNVSAQPGNPPSSTSALPDDAGFEGAVGLMGDIASPHELTDWVDQLVDRLENRFGTMSVQVEERMNEMAKRIDSLETSLQDLIRGASAPIPGSAPASSSRPSAGTDSFSPVASTGGGGET